MLKTANEVCKTMYSKISKIEKYAFISAIVCGLAAHGYMFANKLSFHDDIGDIWGVGLTLASERWFLEVIKRFCATFSINASSAWYNGLISLLFLSVSAAVVVRILDVKEELNAILISGIMVVFPTVAATFAYMFTAPAYCFAVLLICISAYLITQNKLFNVFFGGILMSVSLGIYQAYIGVYTSLAVIVLIQKILNKKEEFRIILKSIASYMAGGTLGIVLYLVMNKVMGIIFNQKSYYAEKDLRLFFDAIISA